MDAPQTQTIKLADGEISCLVSGNPRSAPIIFIHGWLASKSVWRHVIPELSKTHYCIAPDLLGHGDSEKPLDADYSIEAQAHRILVLADKLKIRRFIVCGHSMGGTIAMLIAASKAPGRIIKAINVSGPTMKLSSFMEHTIVPVSQAAAQNERIFHLIQYVLSNKTVGVPERVYFKDRKKKPDDFADIDLKFALQPGMQVCAAKSLESIFKTDLRPVLPKIKCPVLTVFGHDDTVVPIDQATKADELIPNDTLVILKKCGHIPMYEQQEHFMRHVKKFVRPGFFSRLLAKFK